MTPAPAPPAPAPAPGPAPPASGPLHVVYGVQSLDVGGLERVVLDLIRVGRRRGHRSSVVCLERPGALAPQAAAGGAAVVSLDKPAGRTPWLVDRAAAALAALAPDVLHTHTVGALWYLGPAARRAGGVPVVHTEHTDSVRKAAGLRAKLRTRLLWHRAAKFAGRFCGVSDEVTRSAVRWGTVPRRKAETILNGIDTELYADASPRLPAREAFGIPAAARVVGTVGRLNEIKRQDLLLRAVGGLGPAYADVRVLLVGDGPERGALEALAGALGLGPRVHFAGFQAAPERLLPAMDVFALTSRLEGLPLALLEAWAAGRPVVASAVGGVPQAVRDGETGLLFANGDQPGLARALARLLDDPGLRGRLGAAGRAVVRERYSLDRMAAEYEARYRAVLAERGAG